MEQPYRVVDDVFVLPSSETAPGHGVLPVNAYLVAARSPILIDTGLAMESEAFLKSLWSLVDPEDLGWVLLTHEDPDHAGNLLAVLERASQARLVVNYVTLGKLLEAFSISLERVVVVNPGGRVPGLERALTVLRPPVYDSPGTIGFHDAATGVLFTVDAFGTYLPELVADLAELDDDDALRTGLADFNRANHPWVTLAEPSRFASILGDLARLEPTVLLSSHGVPARGRAQALLDAMAALPTMEPYVPPDQERFEQLRPEMGP